MFIGDALAWPLHWYYDTGPLEAHKSRYYGGRIERLTDVPSDLLFRHPNSGDHMKKCAFAFSMHALLSLL